MAAAELKFEVSNLGGPLCDVSVATGAALQELKAAIAAACGIPAEEQRLIDAEGQELLGARCLQGFTPESEVALGLVRIDPERAALLARAAQDPMGALRNASKELRADRAMVLAAVAQNGEALCYASEELCADREVVVAALATSGKALQFASEKLRADREMVLAAVAQNGAKLRARRKEVLAALAQLREDPWLRLDPRAAHRVVLPVLVKDSGPLQFASRELRAERQVVLAAVAQNGLALKFASEELRGDHECIVAASEELRGDHECIVAAVAQNGHLLHDLPVELRADREVVAAAEADELYADRKALQFASEKLRADRTVLAAPAQKGAALQSASKELCARSGGSGGFGSERQRIGMRVQGGTTSQHKGKGFGKGKGKDRGKSKQEPSLTTGAGSQGRRAPSSTRRREL